MRASTIIAVAASAVAVSATYSNETWTTTEVVTSYTTYCPYPTTIVQNNHTYTVTEATTLTITDCPCTLTQTYTTVTETHCPGGCDAPTDFPQVPHYPNVTVEHPVHPEPTHGADNVTTPHVPDYDGAANRATLAGGALAAIIGVAAYLL